MLSSSAASGKPAFLAVGETDACLFGQPARARAERLAANAGLTPTSELPNGEVLLGNLRFAWDPAWLKELARRPGAVLVKDGQPVLANLPAKEAPAMASAMQGGTLPPSEYREQLDADTAELSYFELRKRERPFVRELTAGNALAVERAFYDAAYKGVTDVLTLYLWRRPAFWLTRWAAMAGLTPKVLHDRIQKLERFGLLVRRAYPEVPPRVEYEFTEQGRRLVELVRTVGDFVERWRE